MVYDWYELTLSSLTILCSIVLLVSLTHSMIRRAASLRLALSMSANTQLMSEFHESISECPDIDEALPDNLVGLFRVDNDEKPEKSVRSTG